MVLSATFNEEIADSYPNDSEHSGMAWRRRSVGASESPSYCRPNFRQSRCMEFQKQGMSTLPLDQRQFDIQLLPHRDAGTDLRGVVSSPFIREGAWCLRHEFMRTPLLQGAYPVPHAKRTSWAPSPRIARDRSSGVFVLWELHRVTEQPEVLGGGQLRRISSY